MMSLSLQGWVIVLLGSRSLIGLADDGKLEPAYELESGIVQGQHGEAMIVHRCQPIIWLASASSVRVPSDAITIRVSTLSTSDQATLAHAVEACRSMIDQYRAAQAGIVVAPETALSSIPRQELLR